MKKLIAVLALAAVSSVWAADVSQMAILGIKLGDKYENIKKKLPCQNKINVKFYCSETNSDIKTNSIKVECNKSSEFFSLATNSENTIIKIARDINFDTQPNWVKLENDIVQQYGKPTSEKSDNNFYNLCYGNCKADGTAEEVGIAMEIQILKTKNMKKIYFTLKNKDQVHTQYESDKQKCEKLQSNNSDKASKIQF